MSLAGTIGGSLIAGGAGASTLATSARIAGSVIVAGTITVSSELVSLLGTMAANLTLCLGHTVHSLLALSVSTLVTAANLSCLLTTAGIVDGSTTQNTSNTVAPASPASTSVGTDGFQGYSHDPADYLALGYRQVVWSASDCADAATPLAALRASLVPLVVDALACTSVTVPETAALDLGLNADLAPIANAISLAGVSVGSASGDELSLRLIVPGLSRLLNLCPCLDADLLGTITLDGGAIGDGVSALLYTPGCISQGDATITGQECAGTVVNSAAVSIDYERIGPPGTNLDGTSVSTITAGSLGDRIVLRQLAGG
ncbi:MAG: hypothetical protein QM635_08260 [Microbacteriaceae bacterium]